MVSAPTGSFAGIHTETYMWQICSKIFNDNTTDTTNGLIDLPCRNWFLDALERCSEMIFLEPEITVQSWFVQQVITFRNFLFPRAGKTTIATKNSHSRMHPSMLTKSDCNHLFVEASKDYIETVPKYSRCLEDNLHYAAFLRALFGFFTMYLVLVFVKKLFSRKWWRYAKPNLIEACRISLQESRLLRKMRFFSRRSLARHKFEVNHFRADRTNVARLYCDPPTIAIKVKKKQLSQVLCSLVKSDPVVDEQRNGITRNGITKCRGYALHRLNLFLNAKTYCRVIIDIGFDEHESDSELDEGHLQKFRSMSAGDHLNNIPKQKESNISESGDTSSLSSYAARSGRHCQMSKYKQAPLRSRASIGRSPSSIPTLDKSKDSVKRKKSSKGISLLHRKDSRTMLRRSYERQGSGLNLVDVSSYSGVGSSGITHIQ